VKSRLLVLILAAVSTVATALHAAVPTVEKQSHGALIRFDSGALRLEVWSEQVMRVTYAPGPVIPETHSFSVISAPGSTAFQVKETASAVEISTRALRAKVEKSTGLVSFHDMTGKTVFEEKGPRESTVGDSFALERGEQIYGLGQHQDGYMSYRGSTVHLQQKNMEIGIPVLISSRGYGMLWDNPAITDVEVGIKGKEDAVRWISEAGKTIDYYFILGPKTDEVIAGYRKLTGEAPLLGKWAWGFWQCKERYATQAEMLGIVSRYRENHVPLDGIVQDWQYWKPGGWGTHEFDPARYPDPKGMVDSIHGMHAHVLISVWARFDLDTANEKELEQAGALYPPVIQNVFPKGQGKWYDAFNPEGRRIYWKQIWDNLGKKGLDGWWLDASEPEIGGKWGEYRTYTTAAGPGAEVFNAYPLMTTTGIYQGQRAETDRKRVIVLTRSAYAGQQRNSAISWSGDIHGTWDVFRKQIPAGLNFSMSGIPYWNTDIGGFFGGKTSDPNYQELFVRWYQFGAFTPMFRVHGSGAGKEFWLWDKPTQQTLRKFERLRYRLLPYIYSVSWQVTNNGSSMLRPLVMDFAGDPAALTVGDQYLFGPDLMVNPVTTAGATTRPVYLPGKTAWFDFWTGRREAAGGKVEAAAPIDSMPLYVPAGSILLLGPDLEWVDQKAADPIEVRVYPGANGSFTLYEDAGDSYDYEHGAHATIAFQWNETTRTLTIGKRAGAYEGMLTKRTFRVVLVDQQRGGGLDDSASARSVAYSGEEVRVKLGHDQAVSRSEKAQQH
jgi:alpha-D-xyloside xylohydrolase